LSSKYLRVVLFVSRKSIRAYLVNAHVYELNRTHAKPVTLLVEQEIKEGINLEELREILCQHVPANRIFYSFQESPCPSVVVFRRQIRQVFKEGQKWSSDFMSFKLSQYFVQLAHVYRKTDGYSLANHDHAMALDLYREGLHWWPQFQARLVRHTWYYSMKSVFEIGKRECPI